MSGGTLTIVLDMATTLFKNAAKLYIIGAICLWLLAGNRISVFVRMGESKPDAPRRIRIDANRVCGLFQRIRNRVDVTSNRQSHL